MCAVCAVCAVRGTGVYIDNILTAENKGKTNALDLVFINYVPLVSPLVDMDNQAQMAATATFDWEYYDTSVNAVTNYSYPFTSTNPRHYDYLDWWLLNQRGDMLAANWDCPIKKNKTMRFESIFGSLPGNDVSTDLSGIANAGYADTTPPSTEWATRQVRVLFSIPYVP